MSAVNLSEQEASSAVLVARDDSRTLTLTRNHRNSAFADVGYDYLVHM